MPVLDTNLLIRLDHDDAKARSALAQIDGRPLIVPYQVALEFAGGTASPAAELVALAASFVLDPPNAAVLEEAAALGKRARDAGRRVDAADVWIAAAARVRDDFVVSSNKRHFTALGVPCWNYMRESAAPGD